MPHQMPFGAQIIEGGVRFALFAPNARTVELVVEEGAPEPMTRDSEGFFTRIAPDAQAGSRYRFRIDGATFVPDPASRAQPDGVDEASLVVDGSRYQWRTPDWRGRPWTEAVVYEAHVGTATPEGTFAALAAKLETLRNDGFTAIELMPLAACEGARNWGYDGVLMFAPSADYGTPDDLRALIDRAHELGLMVFLDVVYNHFGPAGNYLHVYAQGFFTPKHQTPWGAGLNFDDVGAAPVRAFFIANALYWLIEFRFDGLRFDAVHAIVDDSPRDILVELAQTIAARIPDRAVHLILENEHNSARRLARDEAARPQLYTAQWNDDLHHCLHVLLTGESDAYYADFADAPLGRLGLGLAQGFVYQGERSTNLGRARGEPSAHLPPEAFVSFLQNHDQIGNRAFGERIDRLTSARKLAVADAILLLSPQIPMLFMGEEWDASSPFQFFVDFARDPALSKAVREGRRREFARALGFSSGDADKIPDPTAASTFASSKLDWSERERAPHAEKLARIRRLLALRRTHVAPLLASGFEGAAHAQAGDALQVEWRFRAGRLALELNIGAASIAPRTAMRLIYDSDEADAAAPLAPWSCRVSATREADHA